MSYDTDIFIAGAGPVGLTIAIDLSSRGVRSMLAEPRRFAEPPNVKCNHVSARSMEIFRRLGVAPALRSAGLPAEYPNDVVFTPASPAPNSRASPSRAGATATATPTGPTVGGPHPSRRTASTRSTSNPSCCATPPHNPA